MLYWDHGDQWHRTQYDVQGDDGEFFVTFETISSLYGSDVGLDDIRMDDGPCNITGKMPIQFNYAKKQYLSI